MNKNPLNNDSFKNQYFQWGLISFVCGILQFTILPLLAHKQFLFPPGIFFSLPGTFFIVTAFFLWLFSSETLLYQTFTTGAGLVFFSTFQILISSSSIASYDILIYVLTLIVGLSLIFSGTDILKVNFRDKLKDIYIYFSSVFSIILLIILILEIYG